jgi:hypothetical protein
VAAWPRRRSPRRSSGEHWHGADAYRTRMAGTGRSSGSLGRRWSYGGGAGVARRELCAAMATAELRELGGCCCEEERKPEAKWERGWVRAGAGVKKARSGASWPTRTDRRRRAAVPRATRRAKPEGGRPPKRFSSSVKSRSRAWQRVFKSTYRLNRGSNS